MNEQKEKQLTIMNVSKSFQVGGEELKVLMDINLQVEQGEFISIIGKSGCGKSTFFRIISGLEKDFTGTVTLDKKTMHDSRCGIGMVFQEPRLFPWFTVFQNVEFGIKANLTKKEKKEHVQHFLDITGLNGFAEYFPFQLSGGMQQRVGLARAFAGKPLILLLDEPFGALDALTRTQMQEEVFKIWTKERITMLMITHDIEEALKLGTKIIVLTNRPARVKRSIKLQTDFSRNVFSPDFIEMRKQIFEDLLE